MREYRTVKIADIDTGDRFIDPGDDELPDLVADIKAHGLQTPILVDRNLALIDGLRRMEAFKPDSEVDVVVSDNYIDTLEVMIKDRSNPFTRSWTTRRVWDFHQATTKQRTENHHNAVRLNMHHFKGKKSQNLPRTLSDLLGVNKRKRVSLSRDAVGKISGYAPSAVQVITHLYAKAQNLSGELSPDRHAFAVDLVKRLDQGLNIYTARVAWEKTSERRQPQISSRSEQQQILRNAAIAASTTGKILTDITGISDDISVEEAEGWLRSFTQARSDYYTICKKLRERIQKG